MQYWLGSVRGHKQKTRLDRWHQKPTISVGCNARWLYPDGDQTCLSCSASLGLAVVDDLLLAHAKVSRKKPCGGMSHLVANVARWQQVRAAGAGAAELGGLAPRARLRPLHGRSNLRCDH